MNKKVSIIAILVFFVGVLMLFGSSYSLINNVTSNETYSFDVANFDVEFSDNTKITISGIPMDDNEGIEKSPEFTFTVANKSEYDVNYRLDILEKSSIEMSDVIHYAYSLNNSNYSKAYSLKDYYTINQNKVLKTGEIDTYKVKMWLSIDADESYMNKVFSATILLDATQNEYKYATNVLEKLASNNQDDVIKTDDGYRYSKYGNNYIWFNCEDGFTRGEDYCEKWLIIGSFQNKSEKSIQEYPSLKIVSTKSIDDISFNNEEKNGDYNNSYIETYANGYFYDNLNTDSKKYILRAKWNIGNTSSTNYQEALLDEKKKEFYSNIGLVNVSDYLYFSENDFLPNNTLLLNKNNNQVTVKNEKLLYSDSLLSYTFVPCIYLRSDVSIIAGDGSLNNPYEISIKYPMNY